MLGHSKSNSISGDEEQSVQMEGTQRGKEKAKRKRPPMKKRSETWNHFTLLENNPKKMHIKTCETYKTFWKQKGGSKQNLTVEGGEENASNLILVKG